MKNQRLVTILTLINLGIFIFLSFDRLGTVEAREHLATCFEGVRSKLSMPKERCGHRSMSLPKVQPAGRTVHSWTKAERSTPRPSGFA